MKCCVDVVSRDAVMTDFVCSVLKLEQSVTSSASVSTMSSSTSLSSDSTHTLKTKKKIIVGNISKYVAAAAASLLSFTVACMI